MSIDNNKKEGICVAIERDFDSQDEMLENIMQIIKKSTEENELVYLRIGNYGRLNKYMPNKKSKFKLALFLKEWAAILDTGVVMIAEKEEEKLNNKNTALN